MRKDRLDRFGVVSLLLVTALLGLNQVVVKVGNEGFQPVFAAGLRSAGAVICLGVWMWVRGISLRPKPGTWGAGLVIGLLFSLEFVFLFNALDLTTVARSSLILYSMPIWLALMGHVLLEGERITRLKALGLGLAFAGVAWAILDRPDEAAGEASLLGDLCALGAALSWAATAVMARGSVLRHERAEVQLMWQIVISAVVLLAVAPLFGPLIRELAPLHLWGLAFQVVVVVSFGFVAWLWLLARYPAASVAAFSFLGPVFGVALGWLLLGERIGPSILGALTLVALGLVLINRPQVPQKV